MLFASSIPDVMGSADAVKGIHEELGYPIYFILFIGVAKILGVIALLVPGFPRVKEWAYAGLMFDMAAALYSFLATGTPISLWGLMALPLTLGILSYVYYHKRLNASISKDIN